MGRPLEDQLPPQETEWLDDPDAEQRLAAELSGLRTHSTKGTNYYMRDKKEFAPHIETVIRESSARFGLNPEMVRTILLAESGGWSKITSNKGAVGAGQWMPDSWKSWSKKHYGASLPLEDREDPMKAIPVTANFLAWIQQYLSDPEFRKRKEHRDIEAVPADSWNRGDWGKIWGAYNTGIYGFVGWSRWKNQDYMQNMIEKRLKNAQKALRPQTRILLFGDSVTDGYHKTNDIKNQMRQRGWDVLVIPKTGSDSKFWLRTFKSPETTEQIDFNKQISQFNPTYIVAGSLGGNDSKYLMRSIKSDDIISWDFYKNRYVEPLMGIVSQWGGPPPAGSDLKRFDYGYDKLKKQINDEYREMAKQNKVDYHDAREATKNIGMTMDPQAWHFTPSQYRDLWTERNKAIENLVRGYRPLVGPPVLPPPMPEPPTIFEPKEIPEDSTTGTKMPKEDEYDDLLRQIQQKQKFFQLERRAAIERIRSLLSENA